MVEYGMKERSSVNALVVASMHLYKDTEGQFYSPAIYNNEFFKRYLDVFDEISLVAKVKCICDYEKEKYIKIDTTHIKVFELPWYQGMKQMSLKLIPLLKVYRNAVTSCDCYIFRALQVESMFAFLLRKKKLPYVVEVVNDPGEWPNFGYAIKKGLTLFLKRMINHASGASYVTKYVLQKKYPGISTDDPKFFTSYYSSVELEKEDIREPKEYPNAIEKFSIVHIANAINGDGKGHKTVLLVVEKLKQKGHLVTARFVGDGPSVSDFEIMARDLGIEEQVVFIGRISERRKMLDEIRNNDIFLFPTYSEGLPRSIIEACAVGVPCLSTPVGGIPELLDEEFLFAPDDVEGFALKIEELMQDHSKLNEMSRQNVETSKQYEKSILSERRRKFYSELYDHAKGCKC